MPELPQGPPPSHLTRRSPRKRHGDVFQGPGWLRALREFLYGFSTYEIVQHNLHLREELERLFIMVTMGDLLGIPVLPPYYSLRLVPYVIPHLAHWKRDMLRDRDILDSEVADVHV